MSASASALVVVATTMAAEAVTAVVAVIMVAIMVDPFTTRLLPPTTRLPLTTTLLHRPLATYLRESTLHLSCIRPRPLATSSIID